MYSAIQHKESNPNTFPPDIALIWDIPEIFVVVKTGNVGIFPFLQPIIINIKPITKVEQSLILIFIFMFMFIFS
jgi:hypothetical protein